METVEVVIKIPKQDFDFIIDEFAEGDMPDKKDLKETTYYAIANGTVLPKEHGRLIDTDRLSKDFNTALREKDIHTDAEILEVLGDLLDNAHIVVKENYE